MYHVDDTIAAIASAPGGAARGIVRLSGPAARAVIQKCFQPTSMAASDLSGLNVPTAIAGVLNVHAPIGSLPSDVYFWPSGRSYTRQIAAEIHTIGAPPVLSAALATLCACGARLAEPGEFTLRAFLAGRLDLTQAEAVLGVIDAVGRRDFETALAQLAGGLSRPLMQLREMLLDLLAHLEAGLDFVEEDIQFVSSSELACKLDDAIAVIRQSVEQMTSRTDATQVVRIVLLGWPNVGKSSLFNALTRGPAALVSPQPGTTRDYLTAWLDLDGLRCQLVDTAGIEPDASGSGVGSRAQCAAAEQDRVADVRVLCLDSTRPLNRWERGKLSSQGEKQRLVVLTKCDTPSAVPLAELACDAPRTSALTGTGLDVLRERLRDAAQSRTAEGGAVLATASRCRESLQAALETLTRAAEINAHGGGEELIAAEIRESLVDLGKVVGAVYTDDILDRIFSRFCIGK